MNNEEPLDLIIIGAAAVGSAAAVYAARRGINFIVLAKDIGGEVALSGEVENWPGTIHTTGIELSQNFHEHMKSYDANIEEGVEVTGIVQENRYHIVTGKDASGKEQTWKAKSVIIGTGIHPRLLDIPGEKELKGKGVTYCTVCDGPLFKGKTTATIGAGSSALESALMMASIAKKVYLVTKYPNTDEYKGGFPKGEDILVKKLKTMKNVEIIYEAKTTSILGNTMVEGFTYQDAKGEKHERKADGVMVHIGMIPNSDFVDCVKKDKAGQIDIDILCNTSCPGIFSGGDVTVVPYNQIAIASGHGVIAALSAIDYLNKWEA